MTVSQAVASRVDPTRPTADRRPRRASTTGRSVVASAGADLQHAHPVLDLQGFQHADHQARLTGGGQKHRLSALVIVWSGVLPQSQKQPADSCDLHWTFVGQVERGRRNIAIHSILKLAYGSTSIRVSWCASCRRACVGRFWPPLKTCFVASLGAQPRYAPAPVKRFALETADGVRLDAALHEPAVRPAGIVLQLHGITVDMDEGGMFVRLAEGFADAGFTVLRFSFRGHGRSGGTDHGMTVAGEMLDLEAALHHADEQLVAALPDEPVPLSIVAASFGAVPTLLSLPFIEPQPHRLVLWNPVLDLVRTFVHPELPWGRANFGGQVGLSASRGHILINGSFELGRVVYEEMRHYSRAPYDSFIFNKTPALVVHGDRDTAVSYDIATAAVVDRRATGTVTDFHTVVGSDHGFDSREREDEAIQVTVDWLTRQYRI